MEGGVRWFLRSARVFGRLQGVGSCCGRGHAQGTTHAKLKHETYTHSEDLLRFRQTHRPAELPARRRYVVRDEDSAKMLLAPLREEAKHGDAEAVARCLEDEGYILSLAQEPSFKTQARCMKVASWPGTP